jgi:hypothetical protein
MSIFDSRVPVPESLTPDEYQPRILGTGQSPTLPVTEFVIVGKDQLQALTALLGVLREHNVGLLGLESQSMPATKHFVITTFADMRNSDCGLEEMLETLRRVLAVDSVKGADLEGSAYDRYLFPVVALDGSRLITSPVQNIVEVEGYFSTLSYDAGNLLMFATGRQSGLALVRSLRRSHAGEFQNEMLGMAVDELRTSGWGIFAFDVGALESGTVTVLVRETLSTRASPRRRKVG